MREVPGSNPGRAPVTVFFSRPEGAALYLCMDLYDLSCTNFSPVFSASAIYMGDKMEGNLPPHGTMLHNDIVHLLEGLSDFYWNLDSLLGLHSFCDDQ